MEDAFGENREERGVAEMPTGNLIDKYLRQAEGVAIAFGLSRVHIEIALICVITKNHALSVARKPSTFLVRNTNTKRNRMANGDEGLGKKLRILRSSGSRSAR